jgi:photosystem II stability/assembly factor-like uncharacterized protein
MRKLIALFVFLPFFCFSQRYEILPLTTGANTSIRGLSVVSDQVAWVSGSNGHIGKTTDGGATWKWIKPAGFEDYDFRDIEAFDDQKAIIVNAGSPAFVFMTLDGGETWTNTYKNTDPAIFLDGMDFWDEKNGMIFGDPIQNKLQLLKTSNGGLNWEDISDQLKMPMLKGETSFAASGTTIKTLGKGKVWIATGGTVSNIYHSSDYGKSWTKYPCPIWQGENSTGPFSMDFYDANTGIVVGGNYMQDTVKLNNALISRNGGREWMKPQTSVSGYRSGVTYLNKDLCVAVGTSGVDLSKDGGLNWKQLSRLNFNAVKKAKNGNLVLLAGNKGMIYRLILPKP